MLLIYSCPVVYIQDFLSIVVHKKIYYFFKMTFESPIYLMDFITSRCIVSFENLKEESLLAVVSPRLFTTLLTFVTGITFQIVYYINSVLWNNLNDCVAFNVGIHLR